MKKFITGFGVVLIITVFAYEQYLNNQSDIVETSSVAGSVSNTSRINHKFLPSSTTNQVICHDNFVLSYNEAHEQAEWVAYQLNKSDIVHTDRKRPFFIQDKAVTTKSADWRNYKNTGFDKGHLCPAGDRKYTMQAYNETFLTSNIAPQDHDFNAGIWNELEQQIRSWVKQDKRLYIVTGGVLEDELKTIGRERVSVPNYFYKIVFKDDGDNSKLIGFIMPNTPNNQKPLKQYVVSVDHIERLTGLDFFPVLDDSLENKLEESVNTKGWQFR